MINKPQNRMQQQVSTRKEVEIVEAPPIALPGKVTPCVCPLCGKAQSPIVRHPYPDKGYARVYCGACAGIFHFIYATPEFPTPRVRFRTQ
jgi:hypothetical protein